MKIVLLILVIILIIILIAYAYYGGFSKVNVFVDEQGGEVCVYESVVGDYSQTAKYTNKIYYDLLNNYKIETYKGFGTFFDNPQKVDKSKLRSDVGCILEPSDDARTGELQAKYKVKTFSRGSYVVAEFPLKGKMSFIFGVFKVYPAIIKFCKMQGYSEDTPVTEIYDVPNKKIIYRKDIK